ncbi:hypothetical protein FS749_007237 [Ceratobasidium sp. UAMH 11750]|nr:hypothetical protein FS749_007237 [Ceratobasidium sp. UAMH 11750]
MPPKSRPPAPKRKAVVRTHYESGPRGKVVKVKRRRTETAENTHPIPRQPSPSTSGTRSNTLPAPVLPNITHYYDFDDDAGAEIEISNEGIEHVAPSKTSPNLQLKNWLDNYVDSYVYALYAREAAPSAAQRSSYVSVVLTGTTPQVTATSRDYLDRSLLGRRLIGQPRPCMESRPRWHALYPNTDYAIASAIAALLVHGLLLIGLTYDIFCHWFAGFTDRALEFPTHIALPVELDILGGVPRFHIAGHIEKCRVRHSLNYKPFVGRIEGEGCERAWAFLNETAGSTLEKSPGARWDAINYTLDDWNFEKMITMATFLCSKFQDAKKMHKRQSIVFKELDSSLPPETTAEWRKESTEPCQENGRWTSPFFGKNDWDWGVKEALHKEQANKEARQSDTGNQKGVLKWISQAIELENALDKLRADAMELSAKSTPRQHNLINDRRKLYLTRVTTL